MLRCLDTVSRNIFKENGLAIASSATASVANPLNVVLRQTPATGTNCRNPSEIVFVFVTLEELINTKSYNMKRLPQVKDKMRMAGLLIIIILLIAFGQISSQQNYTDLGKNISSIYEDRLLPSTYIYQISEHLYQKHLLHEQSGQEMTEAKKREQAEHNKAISSLIENYENTFLTRQEIQHWKQFKDNLNRYLALDNSVAADEQRRHFFTEARNGLQQLSDIQIGEARNLRKSSKAIINGTIITSNLEVVLLIVLGAITIAFLYTNKKPPIYPQAHRHSLN